VVCYGRINIKGDTMEKEVVKLGNSIGITFNKAMQYLTEFKAGDILEVKCSKGKLVLVKKKEEK
jgi:antitoxin component of MazEF toxin-antitoxin module